MALDTIHPVHDRSQAVLELLALLELLKPNKEAREEIRGEASQRLTGNNRRRNCRNCTPLRDDGR
jgi:hypothetical protein